MDFIKIYHTLMHSILILELTNGSTIRVSISFFLFILAILDQFFREGWALVLGKFFHSDIKLTIKRFSYSFLGP